VVKGGPQRWNRKRFTHADILRSFNIAGQRFQPPISDQAYGMAKELLSDLAI
jgi:hypothetical protein